MPALLEPHNKAKYLGADFEALYNDFYFELSKFGPIDTLRIPKPSDIGVKEDEIGSVFVKFFSLSSAFSCYNLLNGKPFLSKGMDILFVNEF